MNASDAGRRFHFFTAAMLAALLLLGEAYGERVVLDQPALDGALILGGSLHLGCLSQRTGVYRFRGSRPKLGSKASLIKVPSQISNRRRRLKLLRRGTPLFSSNKRVKVRLRREIAELRAARKACAEHGAPACAAGSARSVSQYGITWTLDRCYPAGQFANTDWWVVGPVKIIDIDPKPVHEAKTTSIGCAAGETYREYTSSCNSQHKCSYVRKYPADHYTSPSVDFNYYPESYVRETTCSADQDCSEFRSFYRGKCASGVWSLTLMRHGFRINPAAPGMFYDSRVAGYSDEYFSALPLTVEINASLISSISYPEQTVCRRDGAGADGWYDYRGQCSESSPLQTAAVLTVLPSVPPQGSFRPPYAGSEKSVRFRTAQLHEPGKGLAVLANLATPNSTAIPDVTGQTRIFERVWLNYALGWSQQFNVPRDNAFSYGREVASTAGQAALLLNSAISEADKLKLLIPFLQAGIDHAAAVENGMYWPPDGGHASGRKLLILFAGKVLNDGTMLNVGRRGDNSGNQACGDAVCFGEDAQTFYVDPDNIGKYFTPPYSSTPLLYGDDGTTTEVERYESRHAGLPEWGIRHWERTGNSSQTSIAFDRLRWKAGYRQCCNAVAWAGYVLTAHIMGLREAWNHDALFDYQDRYMQVTLAGSNPESGWRPTGFAAAMWDAYRAGYGCQWMMDNPSDPYSNGYYDCGGARITCSWQESACPDCSRVTQLGDYPNARAQEYDPCHLN